MPQPRKRGVLVIHVPYIYNFNEKCVKWNSPEAESCRTQLESSQRCSDFRGGQKASSDLRFEGLQSVVAGRHSDRSMGPIGHIVSSVR